MAAPVLDTNILIDWLCDRPGASNELARYPSHRISRLSWMEVLAGEAPERRAHVIDLLEFFEIIELDARIALAGAAISHRLRLKLIDALILASAQVNDAILITRNTKDFPANMLGIRVPYTL